jgi:hypothetical protein
MAGMLGWSVVAGHWDPSLTRFSVVKTFNRVCDINPMLMSPVLGADLLKESVLEVHDCPWR